MKYYQIMIDDESISEECIKCSSEDDFQQKYNIEKYGVFEGKKIENWDNNFTFFYDEKEGHIWEARGRQTAQKWQSPPAVKFIKFRP